MSKTDEPQWMTDRVRDMEQRGELVKRSPLDPPRPPIRFEDFVTDDELSTTEEITHG